MVAVVDETFFSFLNSYFKGDDFKVYQLAGDASNRRYYRILKENQSWVLMVWEPFNPETYPFLSVLNHFAKHQVGVPNVISMSPSEGLVLLEDLGDLTLERKYWEAQNPESSMNFYQQAVDELIKIHFKATLDKNECTAFKMKFDTEKFLWEMNYAKEHLLDGVCKFAFTEKSHKELIYTFTEICSRLDEEPKFIAHRDYHSRNLMIKYDDMRVIDFQDARLGPVQYDLVSLFRDSYVNMSDEMAKRLTDYYLEKARPYLSKDLSRSYFDEIYELQTVQRCFKACGSFASFYMTRNDKRYLKYLTHTLRRVLKSLSNFPEYKLLNDILIDSGAIEKNYEAL